MIFNIILILVLPSRLSQSFLYDFKMLLIRSLYFVSLCHAMGISSVRESLRHSGSFSATCMQVHVQKSGYREERRGRVSEGGREGGREREREVERSTTFPFYLKFSYFYEGFESFILSPPLLE